jgi:hypothetical protein
VKVAAFRKITFGYIGLVGCFFLPAETLYRTEQILASKLGEYILHGATSTRIIKNYRNRGIQKFK